MVEDAAKFRTKALMNSSFFDWAARTKYCVINPNFRQDESRSKCAAGGRLADQPVMSQVDSTEALGRKMEELKLEATII